MPSRRSRAAAIVAVAMLAGAGLHAVSVPEPAPACAVVVVPPAPPVPAVPAPTIELTGPLVVFQAPEPRVDPLDLGPCPARVTRGHDVELGALPDDAGLDRAVTASWFDVHRLAVWTETAVYLSTDEGETFRRVLDHAGAVHAAAFDCHGRLHVARAEGDDALVLGTVDDGAAQTEQWTRVATTRGRGRAVLVPFEREVAVLVPDPERGGGLRIARRDPVAGWRSVALWSPAASWGGVDVLAIDPRRPDRVRVLAMPWQGGECGASIYYDLTVDLRTPAATARELGDELPRDRRPRIPNTQSSARDAAGRWLAIAGEGAALVRLTAAEVAARRNADD